VPFPRMTTRRWLAITAIVAIGLWLGVTAKAVINDHQSERLYHLWERFECLEPGSIYNSGHKAPFWPRYWRRLLGRPWPGTYVCDHSGDPNRRVGRLVVSVSEPSYTFMGDLLRSGKPLPPNYHGNQAYFEYYQEYVPRHWKKDADGIWTRSPEENKAHPNR
jgi:hypothetical protein